MNDTEEAVRRLFAAAAEEVPPGIDLLRGVRARSRRRAVRIRAAVAAGTAGIVAAAAAITLSAVPTPSAFAQVTHAAARTAAGSYQVRSAERIVQIGGLRSKPWATAYGEFDPVHGVGEQTDNLGGQIRYIGDSMYVFLTDGLRAAYNRTGPPVPAWAAWVQFAGIPLQPGVGMTAAGLALLGAFPGQLGQVDPQDLLALLQSVTQVREVGPGLGERAARQPDVHSLTRPLAWLGSRPFRCPALTGHQLTCRWAHCCHEGSHSSRGLADPAPFTAADTGWIHDVSQDPALQHFVRVPSPYPREHAEFFVHQLAPAGWDSGQRAEFLAEDTPTGTRLSRSARTCASAAPPRSATGPTPAPATAASPLARSAPPATGRSTHGPAPCSAPNSPARPASALASKAASPSPIPRKSSPHRRVFSLRGMFFATMFDIRSFSGTDGSA